MESKNHNLKNERQEKKAKENEIENSEFDIFKNIFKAIHNITLSIEKLADNINTIHVNNVKCEVNINTKFNDMLKKTVDIENAINEGIRMSISVKDKTEKNFQILNELILLKSDTKKDVKDNENIMDEVALICSDMQVKLNKNHQILKENVEINRQIKDTNASKQDKKVDNIERFQKFELNLTKMEEKNANIVCGLEERNSDLNKTKNIKLKDRIINFNKTEWTTKFTKNSNNQFENLNVTDITKHINTNLHQENLENFNCYQCDHTFKTLNMLMNHKYRNHKRRTKCRNVDMCQYKENCWFSHEDEDTDSVKTYYTT